MFPFSTEKFTREQLCQAFDIVKNPDDWKMSIDIVIDNPGDKNLRCLEEAIIYFTGTGPFINVLDNNKVQVTAPGYYAMGF